MQNTKLVIVFLLGLIMKASFGAEIPELVTNPGQDDTQSAALSVPASDVEVTAPTVAQTAAPAAKPTAVEAAPVAAPAAAAVTTTPIAPTPATDTTKAQADRAAQVQYNNNITVQPPLTQPKALAFYKDTDDATSVLGTKSHAYDNTKSIAITPMAGTSGYVGSWAGHITNSYVAGLALEVPVTSHLSLEVEGARGEYQIGYSNFLHGFNRWDLGGDAKIYLLNGIFRPYVGAGIMSNYYENMSRGPLYAYSPSYNQWMGSGELLAGAEIAATDGLSFGVRGTYGVPMFNKAATGSNGYSAIPGLEEADAMNSSFYKVMGTVRVAF